MSSYLDIKLAAAIMSLRLPGLMGCLETLMQTLVIHKSVSSLFNTNPTFG
jgi:hypothetical protein